MTKHETNSETVDSTDSDAVVAPFKQDKAPHHITVGKSRAGSTSFSTKHQRFAEMFEDDSGAESTNGERNS
jgi:hypothetical protein